MLSDASGRSIFGFFGQHCNGWQHESQSRLRLNLVSAGNLRHINIIHTPVVQAGKLIFVVSEIAPPPKFCGPVRPNTSNMPKAGPENKTCNKT